MTPTEPDVQNPDEAEGTVHPDDVQPNEEPQQEQPDPEE